jgi:uncharacterized BrkB/YihY/UPF0761 family membrane protein
MYISKISFRRVADAKAAAAYFATFSIAPIVSYNNTRASKFSAPNLREDLT